MTLCPIARAVGCKKCPIVALCPLKGVIGDYIQPPPPGRTGGAGAPVRAASRQADAPVKRVAAARKATAKRRAKKRR